MRYISTRGPETSVSFKEAVAQGLADDGGLFVPASFPKFDPSEFDEIENWADFGKMILRPFVEPDVGQELLDSICDSAFNFSVELREVGRDTAILELFHGPTAAFKDIGARFLAEYLRGTNDRKLVLVATSGDTGGAVAAAFHGIASCDVVILFPNGRISPRQQAQLTTWGDNVHALAVEGDFDDCQTLVKRAFAEERAKGTSLISANSISLGRLLPQTVYYAAASTWYYRKHRVQPGFVIPTGNLGNAVACFWAREMGFPIREIALASNANRAINVYFAKGAWQPRPTVSTLANAMDVGNPSNFERLRFLFPGLETLRKIASSFSITDAQISETISEGPKTWEQIWCPHTATAVFVREQLQTPHWIIVSTAHPAKFESIIEPLLGHSLETPSSLMSIIEKPQSYKVIAPTFELLSNELRHISSRG